MTGHFEHGYYNNRDGDWVGFMTDIKKIPKILSDPSLILKWVWDVPDPVLITDLDHAQKYLDLLS